MKKNNTAHICSSHSKNEVHWQATAMTDRWKDMGTLTAGEYNGNTESFINVSQATGYQLLDKYAWGGCFNERGWRAMEHLSDKEKTEILEALFGETGLKLNVGRTPVAASDYAIEPYSYNETADDYEMKNFSIQQDKNYLLPYIKRAIEIQPELKVWASPWTPPSWLKTNNSLIGGTIEATDENFKAYALYFAKYIQAYKEEGVDVYMIMPQNEPTMNTAYASCVWTGEQLNTFIKDYLAPTLKEQGLDTEIWLGTFTDSDSTRVDPTLNDPDTVHVIKGVAFQWWGKQKSLSIYRQNTGLKLMQSETMCGDGKNNWDYAEAQFDLIKSYFESGVNAYMLWNMVLDETGANTAANPWHQNAPVTVDSHTNQISYNPHYYLFKHFSHYIEPGARRIKTEGSFTDCIAFQNKNGDNVLVVKNSHSKAIKVTINFNGKLIHPVLPAHSFHTFVTGGEVIAAKDAVYTESYQAERNPAIVKFLTVSGSQAISVSNASMDNGAALILYDNQGTADQIWSIEPTDNGAYKLVNSNSLRLASVPSDNGTDDANIIQWDDGGLENQQWILEKTEYNGKACYKIVNCGCNKVLAIASGNVKNGTQIIQQTYTGKQTQLWEVVVVSDESGMFEKSNFLP